MISLKRLKQHWMAGPLGGPLSAALVLTALLASLLAAPRIAHAQTLNRLPTWAVVSFTNNSGYGGNEVGVEASDGFVVELGKSNKYDVLPRSQTQQTIADLGLVEPLDIIGLQKLARALEADAVATGEVASVTFSNSPRRATVTLIIRVVDRTSGEFINGAIAQGTSTPRPIPTNDDDSLVNQAIANADFDSVRQISAFNLPRATVLIHRDRETVTINKGTQDGIYDGLSMLVTRNGSEVGRIRVASAGPDESEATVTDQGLGINAQDVATAIYQLPAYSLSPGGGISVGRSAGHAADTSGNAGGSHSFFTGPIGAVLAGAVGVGIFALATSGHGSSGAGGDSLGGGQVGGQQAILKVGPDAGISDITPPAENAVNAATFVPAAVQITWNQGNINAGNVIEYHVYRDPEPTLLTTGAYFQTPTATSAEFVPIPIISPATPGASFDSVQDVTAIFVQKPSRTDNTALITGDFFASPEIINGVSTAGQFPIPGTGLQIGQHVRYWVEALYTIPNLNTAGTIGTGPNTGVGTLIYSLSIPAYTNYITYLQPVFLRQTVGGTFPHGTTPNPSADPFGLSTSPNNVTVTVPTVFGNGATLEYALDFSTSEGFSPNNTARYTQTVPSTGNFELDPRNGPAIQFPNIDLTSGLAQSKLGSNPGSVYVRIGVRDTRNSDTDANYVYTTVDLATATDANSHTNLLPTQLTPGNAVTTAARANVVQKLLQTQALRAAHVVRLQQTPLGSTPGAAHSSLAPSASSLHPQAQPLKSIPVTPPRVLKVRPTTPGH